MQEQAAKLQQVFAAQIAELAQKYEGRVKSGSEQLRAEVEAITHSAAFVRQQQEALAAAMEQVMRSPPALCAQLQMGLQMKVSRENAQTKQQKLKAKMRAMEAKLSVVQAQQDPMYQKVGP